jgi:hypothetical protein
VNNPGTATTPPVFNQLLGVNDGSISVGFYTDAAGVTHGHTYTTATKTFSANIDDPLATGGNTTDAAINNSGLIAGFCTDAGGNIHSFIDNGGTFTTLDGLGAMDTSLLGLNNLDEAAGYDIDGAGMMHGIIGDVNAHTCRQADDPNGIGSATFNGVDNKGQIVGFYVNGPDNTIRLLAHPVPEPFPSALVFTGLIFGLQPAPDGGAFRAVGRPILAAGGFEPARPLLCSDTSTSRLIRRLRVGLHAPRYLS